MLVEEIDTLKQIMEKQIVENRPYGEIYETSVAIDKLLVKYYKLYGIRGIKPSTTNVNQNND